MTPEILQLVGQLGIAGLMFYLLLEERKARQALESKISNWLEEELEASRPKRPEGMA